MAGALRLFQTGDEKAVTALIFSVLDEYGLEPAPKTTDRDLADIGGFYEDGVFAVLADDETNEITGTVGLKPIGENVVELRKMYLKKNMRGRGHGRKLLKFAIEQARQLGAVRIELETAQVLEEAMGLYEAFGFVAVTRDDMEKRCDRVLALNL